MKPDIRRAEVRDIPRIDDLLEQVNRVHHDGRPDLFNLGRKYTDDELRALLQDDLRPIFVACDREDRVLGYAFCVHQSHPGDNILTDITTLYIDDLCVDAAFRGTGIGRSLYEHVLGYARTCGCYNVTLNVWSCNPGAEQFYRAMGMQPMKTAMETIL